MVKHMVLLLCAATFSSYQVTAFTPSSNLRIPQGRSIFKSSSYETSPSSAVVPKLAESREGVDNDNISDNSGSGMLSMSYGDFAQNYPFANNIAIATCKTAAADLIAQVVIAQTPIDWERSLLFCAFGAFYLGGFQYLYQVGVFSKIFDVDSFTKQTLEEKLKDVPGLKALAAQTVLDLTVLTLIYLPTFYIFKAGVFFRVARSSSMGKHRVG
jgi:hypothetical protein